MIRLHRLRLRPAALLIALAAAGFSAGAATINGHAYTPLLTWAGANHFQLTRNAESDEFTARSAARKLVFEKDSNIANINGVRVALSFPVAVDHGQPLVADLDFAKTINPLVAAPSVPARRIRTICLDPGHGGKDAGYHYGAHNEKIYTLALARELQAQLQAAGYKVLITRSTDEYVDLPARPALANRRGADLFISLHFNCSTIDASRVQGPETYCITPVGASSSNAQGEGANHGPAVANRVEQKSLWLAYEVQHSLVSRLGTEDREVRRARFAVLRDATMPAILIESGYMSHPVEGRKIFSTAYRRQLATAILRGIQDYQRLTVPRAVAAAEKPDLTNAHSPHDL